MSRRKMSVTQLTLLTSLSMMGAGIIMLPAKFAEIAAISMLSWIVTALASGAVAYVFAQCGMLSKKLGGLGGFAEYAAAETGCRVTGLTLSHEQLAWAQARAERQGFAAQAEFVLRGGDFVVPDDVKACALAVLRHRVRLAPELDIEGLSVDQVLQQLLDQVPAPRL